MKTLFGWVVAILILVLMGTLLWMRVRSDTDSVELLAGPAAKQARAAEQKYEEAHAAQQSVTMAGPLVNSVKHQDTEPNTDSFESIEYRPTESDHVGGSVVGSSKAIFEKTFGVTGTVQVPFDVPAHAYSPQLHGSFRSYLQGGKLESNASKSDVEFLVLNDEEYADLLRGHPSEAIFSTGAAHDQEVNANLPPTLDKPVRYHLVFRNTAPDAQKLVQANFRIDF